MAQDSIPEALTFDDVLLLPAESAVLPAQVKLKTRLTSTISLNIPIMSAAMDTVTESRMAIALAQAGGIGVIHRNMSIEEQASKVNSVKRFESGLVLDPITITPETTIGEMRRLKDKHGFSGLPVIDNDEILVGIITNRDIRFVDDDQQLVSSMMTTELVTVPEHVDPEYAKKLLHQHRIEKLLVVDSDGKCTGMMTVRDIQRSRDNPDSCKDHHGRLRVAAATGTGEKGISRALALFEAGADVVVVDTAHGHSSQVPQIVKRIKKLSKTTQIIAGNVATKEATKSLIDAGADCIKIGIGPGSICTTRIVAGVGVPQLTAIIDCANEARKSNIPVIADGGIKFSGDFAKALAAGADVVMIGSLFAGTAETPGEIFLHQGRRFKSYRGMGSVAAMADGSADRYFQSDMGNNKKLVPEGVEGQVPYTGSVHDIIHQMIGGLRASMGYTGSKTLKDFQTKTKFIKISPASLTESHTHDVLVTREAPNYPVRG